MYPFQFTVEIRGRRDEHALITGVQNVVGEIGTTSQQPARTKSNGQQRCQHFNFF